MNSIARSADNSFLKTFCKTLKKGRESGAITKVFITGVLPLLIFVRFQQFPEFLTDENLRTDLSWVHLPTPR